MNTNPEIDEYLNKMISNLKSYSSVCHSGNHMLDVIISKYATECEIKNISFSFDVCVTNLKYVKSNDLVTILSNALDNAIEAAEKCEEGKGKITCIFRNINDMFIFKVKNTSIYKPYEKNTKFYTSKKEKDEHGWGIESVKQIVRKYNGEIDFKYDKDFFEVEIIISDNT